MQLKTFALTTFHKYFYLTSNGLFFNVSDIYAKSVPKKFKITAIRVVADWVLPS